MLNETAIWLVVIGLILGLGGYFGIRFITQTKSAAARQVLDRAVAVADAVYAQQFDGTQSFFGGAAPTGWIDATESAALVTEWKGAGEGLDFHWWTTLPSGHSSTKQTFHDELIAGTADGNTVFLYTNGYTLEFTSGGKGFTIPPGQLLRMGIADDSENTYCAVYVRQVIPNSPADAVAAAQLIGIGYQSIKATTPGDVGAAAQAPMTNYADCGMDTQMNPTTSAAVQLLEYDGTTAADELGAAPDLPRSKTDSRLSDPKAGTTY